MRPRPRRPPRPRVQEPVPSWLRHLSRGRTEPVELVGSPVEVNTAAAIRRAMLARHSADPEFAAAILSVWDARWFFRNRHSDRDPIRWPESSQIREHKPTPSESPACPAP